MKIIIAPSKTNSLEKIIDKPTRSPILPELSNSLLEYLSKLKKVDLAALLKIKGKILDETYEYYQLSKKNNMIIKAIDFYKGVVFEQLDLKSYTNEQIGYLNERLLILSALYGPLKPNSVIYPYRLDMTIRPMGINLYAYWQEYINDYFSIEEMIVNLSSDEFSKMIKDQKCFLNIHFYEQKGDKYLKSSSFDVKKARGQFLDSLVKSRITKRHRIKDIEIMGYAYSEEKSSEKDYVFIKKSLDT